MPLDVCVDYDALRISIANESSKSLKSWNNMRLEHKQWVSSMPMIWKMCLLFVVYDWSNHYYIYLLHINWYNLFISWRSYARWGFFLLFLFECLRSTSTSEFNRSSCGSSSSVAIRSFVRIHRQLSYLTQIERHMLKEWAAKCVLHWRNIEATDL